jgi:hypothetical protein
MRVDILLKGVSWDLLSVFPEESPVERHIIQQRERLDHFRLCSAVGFGSFFRSGVRLGSTGRFGSSSLGKALSQPLFIGSMV